MSWEGSWEDENYVAQWKTALFIVIFLVIAFVMIRKLF